MPKKSDTLLSFINRINCEFNFYLQELAPDAVPSAELPPKL